MNIVVLGYYMLDADSVGSVMVILNDAGTIAGGRKGVHATIFPNSYEVLRLTPHMTSAAKNQRSSKLEERAHRALIFSFGPKFTIPRYIALKQWIPSPEMGAGGLD